MIDPFNPSTLYAGTPDSGVFKSLDRGASWRAASSARSLGLVSALTIDPSDTATFEHGFSDSLASDSITGVHHGLTVYRDCIPPFELSLKEMIGVPDTNAASRTDDYKSYLR